MLILLLRLHAALRISPVVMKEICTAALASSSARTGRESQRYSVQGERLIVGTIPFTSECPPRVLLINSRKHPEEWLLPKGGWEEDEDRGSGAVRESWEEAGVLGDLLGAEPLLCEFAVKGKTHDQLHTYYGLRIEEMKEEWPEKKQRGRQLFSLDAAREVLSAQGRRRDREAQCLVLEALRGRTVPEWTKLTDEH